MFLSKSKFVAGMQCLKQLYLQVHEPDLAGEVDEATEAIFSQGHEVGRLAQQRFPGGIQVEADPTQIEAALAKTKKLIANPETPAIFEAAFKFDDVVVRIDLLERLPGNRWRMIEVKSSTAVKDYHLYDVAIQRYVVSGSGLRLSQACLVHLNRNYVYDGKRYEPEKLFTVHDLTNEIAKLRDKLPELLREQKRMLARAAPPEVEPGPQCTNPYACQFYSHCNKPLPEDHISFLPGIRSTKVADLLAMGYLSILAIPADYPLTEREKRAFECVKSGTEWFSGNLEKVLKQLEYPLYFMDFETLPDAIPRFAGMRPYDHLPFQWSVHVQQRPGAKPKHYEFLARDHEDPRQSFVESLCNVLGQNGHVVVYNRPFESGRLQDLSKWLPNYSRQIAGLQKRLWDLLPAVRSHVYHPAFGGSYSMKSVLPALVPEMTYAGMAVADGTQAGLTWKRILQGQAGSAETEEMIEALRAYCCQDTLGMVGILERLKRA